MADQAAEGHAEDGRGERGKFGSGFKGELN